MNSTILSTLIAFLLGISVGFFIGIKRAFRHKVLPELDKIIDEKPKVPIKVLHKSEPKTFEEKRSEAVDKDKPIIKTFYK